MLLFHYHNQNYIVDFYPDDGLMLHFTKLNSLGTGVSQASSSLLKHILQDLYLSIVVFIITFLPTLIP